MVRGILSAVSWPKAVFDCAPVEGLKFAVVLTPENEGWFHVLYISHRS